MDVSAAHRFLSEHLTIEVGRFFSSGESLALGAGLLYEGIRFPVFDQRERVFVTMEGIGLVLTHECDVDQRNARPFTELAIFCPVIPFEHFVAEYSTLLGEAAFLGFMAELARRGVSRVAYLPSGLGELPWGGLLYLNRITHTHVSEFSAEGARRIGALTGYGLQIIDHQLTNHLLRPKAEPLALTA
jgi:hypothetical protein